MSTPPSAVLVEELDDRVLLRLNRPEVRNAVDEQMSFLERRKGRAP